MTAPPTWHALDLLDLRLHQITSISKMLTLFPQRKTLSIYCNLAVSLSNYVSKGLLRAVNNNNNFPKSTIRFKSDVALSNESIAEGGLLKGIRVLDLTRILAGPYCTMLLGDLGAEVIKVENPLHGDDTRAWGPPWAQNKDPTDNSTPESAYFLAINRNKKSICVNLKSADGIELIKKIAVKSDVLVENFVPGKLDELGLGWEELSRINPGLIYTSITGYGHTGPYAQRPGYDVMVEAEGGLMYITGEEKGRPVKVGVAITDLTTGLYAHGAIMASLFARTRTNKGEFIDCSLLDCQTASLVNIASNYLVSGQEAKRMGTAHPSIVPYQVITTKNGYLMIGAGNQRQFKILCTTLGVPELFDDLRFRTNTDRVHNRDELIAILEEKFRQEDTKYWLEVFADKGIPFAPINNIEQSFKHPQVVARKMIQKVEHPKAGIVQLTGIPVKYARNKPSIRLSPPTLGQHTKQILAELLEYSDQEIEVLKTKNVI
ncbi:10602_t:CDS:2 [Ambispora gerdemannii]|uniref:10602_t:CDS:1 n=1 Tax=Ambispora gerdemannii TaxID=144530 RepID=A0A9N9CNY7_9GLOM|nr:10602_t:CDS:2 [Ambispora gerdemannii]